MPSQAAYTRLPSSPSSQGTLEPLDYDEGHIRGGQGFSHGRTLIGVSDSSAWRFFISTCVVVLAVSSFNLAYLSMSSTLQAARVATSPDQTIQSSALKRPSVYLGLENVVFEQSYCRSRGTFPKSFFTYNTHDGPRAEPRHVHAPDDKMALKFGGPVRTVVDVYVPDHGLENCTLSARRYPSSTTSDGPNEVTQGDRGVDIEVYMLPSPRPQDRSAASLLDTLSFVPGRESTSRPFHCPGRSHIYFEFRCAAEDCEITIPLEGVTSLTASAESLTKTGFRITQYEAMECISESK
ncbi:hypothetical protein BD309DRAFT_928027 [Dichomitus squalens]|nr:hypothetical protein BD309DRAFT_928027 [Dichomitus squalens]